MRIPCVHVHPAGSFRHSSSLFVVCYLGMVVWLSDAVNGQQTRFLHAESSYIRMQPFICDLVFYPFDTFPALIFQSLAQVSYVCWVLPLPSHSWFKVLRCELSSAYILFYVIDTCTVADSCVGARIISALVLMSSRSRSPRSHALASAGEVATAAFTASLEAARAAVAAYDAARLAANSRSMYSGPSLSGSRSSEELTKVSSKLPRRSPCIVPHSLHSDGRVSAANTSEGTVPTWSELPDEHDVVYVAPLCTEVDGVGRAKVEGGIPVDEEDL